MANLVDLMVGSIQLGLVSERGGGSFSFRSHLLDLTIYWSVRTERIKPAVVSSLLLDPQAYYNQHYSLQSTSKSIVAFKPTFDSHHRVIEFDSHASIYSHGSSLHQVIEPTIAVRGYLCQDGQLRRSCWSCSCSRSYSQH